MKHWIPQIKIIFPCLGTWSQKESLEISLPSLPVLHCQFLLPPGCLTRNRCPHPSTETELLKSPTVAYHKSSGCFSDFVPIGSATSDRVDLSCSLRRSLLAASSYKVSGPCFILPVLLIGGLVKCLRMWALPRFWILALVLVNCAFEPPRLSFFNHKMGRVAMSQGLSKRIKWVCLAKSKDLVKVTFYHYRFLLDTIGASLVSTDKNLTLVPYYLLPWPFPVCAYSEPWST